MLSADKTDFLDSPLAVFLVKRRDDQVQRFLGVVSAGYFEHAAIDQRREFVGESEA